MFLSVIMPVYNASSTLGKAAQAVMMELAEDMEFIAIDDCSTDDSLLQLKRLGPTVVSLPQRLGPAKVRNLGAQTAKGEFLLFIDADVILQPHWAARIREVSLEPELHAVQGVYTLSTEEVNFVSAYQNDYYHYAFTSLPQRETAIAATFCFVIRRALFLQFGGFDDQIPQPTVEDEEFGYRLHAAGIRIMLDSHLAVRHLARYSIASFSKRKVRMTRSQIKALLRRRANPALKTMMVQRQNKTHHSLSVLVSIPLTALLVLSSILALVGDSWLPLLTLGLLWTLVNAGFWRFFILHRGLATLPALVAMTGLDRLLMGWGIFRGLVDFSCGNRY